MSRGLPAVTPRKLIAALQRAGLAGDRTSGSHYSLRHAGDPTRSVTSRPTTSDGPAWYNAGMVAGGYIDEVIFEPVQDSEFDPAMGLILESLRRRPPTMTIR